MKFRQSIILFCIVCLLGQPALAQEEARLDNIIVTNTRDHLLLYMDVQGAFREKMEKAVKSGVPASFSFFITLHRVRRLWMDEKLADLNITHTIHYDNLKKNYTITRSWNKSKPLVTQSFSEAQKLMSEIEGLQIVPVSKLGKGKQYQIRAKAELSKLTLPLYLHYVLFFVSLWDFETDWYTIDFKY